MKKPAVIIILSVVVVLAIAVGGWYWAGVSHTFIPEEDIIFTHHDISADLPYDILEPTPAGLFAYLANCHVVGVENPWPPVETVTRRQWLPPFNEVSYRADITTPAGSRRYNIFTVSALFSEFCFFLIPAVDAPGIRVYADDLPPGITLSDVAGGGMPQAASQTAVAIDIAPEVPPGQYELKIGLVLDGRDYGTLTCNLEVTE